MWTAVLGPYSIGVVRWTSTRAYLSVVAKTTFALDADGLAELSPVQLGLCADWPEPIGAHDDLEFASDFAPAKAYADVLVVGHAHSATAVTTVDIALDIDRCQIRAQAVNALPATAIPLNRAHLRTGKRPSSLGPSPLAVPAWAHRTLPEGFDFGQFNVAPAEQQLPALRSNPRIRLDGLLPGAPHCDAWLPDFEPVIYLVGSRLRPVEPVQASVRCDTLWIHTDRRVCTLTWRGALAEAPDADGTEYLAIALRSHAPDGWKQLEAQLSDAIWSHAAEESASPALPPKEPVCAWRDLALIGRAVTPSAPAAALAPTDVDVERPVRKRGPRPSWPRADDDPDEAPTNVHARTALAPTARAKVKLPTPAAPPRLASTRQAPAPPSRGFSDTEQTLVNAMPLPRAALPFGPKPGAADKPVVTLSSTAALPTPRRTGTLPPLEATAAAQAAARPLAALAPVRIAPALPVIAPLAPRPVFPVHTPVNVAPPGPSDAELDEPTPAPVKAKREDPLLPLAIHAAVQAGLRDQSTPRAQILGEHGISERQWRAHERRLAMALAKEKREGRHELTDRLRAATAQEPALGPNDEPELGLEPYVVLRAELESQPAAAEVLARSRLSAESWTRIHQQWTRRCRLDEQLATELRRRLQAARAASKAKA